MIGNWLKVRFSGEKRTVSISCLLDWYLIGEVWSERGSMNGRHTESYVAGLVHEFRKYPRETEWVEFKRNNADPHRPGSPRRERA